MLEIIGGVAEFAITLTKGAVGFPGVLLFLAFCAKWVWPLIIPKDELAKLDGDVADEFILKISQLHLMKKRRRRRSDAEEKEREVIIMNPLMSKVKV